MAPQRHGFHHFVPNIHIHTHTHCFSWISILGLLSLKKICCLILDQTELSIWYLSFGTVCPLGTCDFQVGSSLALEKIYGVMQSSGSSMAPPCGVSQSLSLSLQISCANTLCSFQTLPVTVKRGKRKKESERQKMVPLNSFPYTVRFIELAEVNVSL